MTYQDTQGAFLAIGLGDVGSARRLSPIAALAQGENTLRFLKGRVPQNPIHTWSPFASVFCHSSNGQSFAAKRVGQQMLQGFDLAPSAFLYRLHNTRLEPSDVAVGLVPVNLVPVHRSVGGRTGECCHRHHLHSLLRRFTKLSCDERLGWEVSPLAHGVM